LTPRHGALPGVACVAARNLTGISID